jgi:hypothetical protein
MTSARAVDGRSGGRRAWGKTAPRQIDELLTYPLGPCGGADRKAGARLGRPGFPVLLLAAFAGLVADYLVGVPWLAIYTGSWAPCCGVAGVRAWRLGEGGGRGTDRLGGAPSPARTPGGDAGAMTAPATPRGTWPAAQLRSAGPPTPARSPLRAPCCLGDRPQATPGRRSSSPRAGRIPAGRSQ